MDEKAIRQIVQDELAQARRDAQYGVTRVPVHIHNGTDSPNVPCENVTGFQVLPGTGNGVLHLAYGPRQSVVGPPSDLEVLNPPKVVSFPIPVIYGGGGGPAGAFNGGDAPTGTVLMFDNGGNITVSNLWVKTDNGWFSFTPDSII